MEFVYSLTFETHFVFRTKVSKNCFLDHSDELWITFIFYVGWQEASQSEREEYNALLPLLFIPDHCQLFIMLWETPSPIILKADNWDFTVIIRKYLNQFFFNMNKVYNTKPNNKEKISSLSQWEFLASLLLIF